MRFQSPDDGLRKDRKPGIRAPGTVSAGGQVPMKQAPWETITITTTIGRTITVGIKVTIQMRMKTIRIIVTIRIIGGMCLIKYRANSHVKWLKFSDVSGTISVPIIKVMIRLLFLTKKLSKGRVMCRRET
jgi:hypothetical protein